jgi:hypothetical protein
MATPTEVADYFREEAKRCRAMGSEFMGSLLRNAADGIERLGATRDLIGHWPGNVRADGVSARLASALHAAVLSRRDPELAAFYPTAEGGGRSRESLGHCRAIHRARRRLGARLAQISAADQRGPSCSRAVSGIVAARIRISPAA